MQSATTIEELATCFHDKITLIRQKLDLRTVSEEDEGKLSKLESVLGETRVILTLLRAEVNRRKAALQGVEVGVYLLQSSRYP